MHFQPHIFIALMILVLCPGPGLSETWVEADWSGGNWNAMDQLDPDICPGELVLIADPLHFVPAMESTGYDGIWDLAVWQNRLYMAAGGNPPLMTEIGDILVYDYQTNSWSLDYSVDEEGIVVLKVHDGVLYSPGVDCLSTPNWGNIYYNAGQGWVKMQTIPFARHVFDIFFHDDKIWVTTGQGIPNYRGSLFSSADMGETWVEEFSVLASPPEIPYRRIFSATTFGESIIMQSDFEDPEGRVMLELKSDGTLIEHEIFAHTKGMSGFQEFHGQLWSRLRYALNAFDGTTWTNYDLPVGAPNYPSRGIMVFKDRLFISGLHNICASDDAVNWDNALIEQNTDRVFETLETFHGRLYAGSTPFGELYVSSVPASGSLDSEAYCFSAPLAGGIISWQALLQGPTTAVKFQLRSAHNETDLMAAAFLGPDGTSASWYETSGTNLAAAHSGHSCFQYRVRLESQEPRFAPVLQSFQLEPTGLTVVSNANGQLLGFSAHPNPFNPRTTLSFHLDIETNVELVIFDIRGRQIKNLQGGHRASGDHEFIWNGCNDAGRKMPAGVYFARLSMPDQRVVQRMVLVD